MKKLKQLFVIGLAMVAVFAFAACDSCSNDDDTDVDPSGGTETVVTLSSISVDTSAAKIAYNYGDTFSSDGIVVTATYSNRSTAPIDAGNYSVDSSAFNNTESGSYSIGISYTENEVTQTTSYTVTVSLDYGGLYITKTKTEYTVESSSGVTVTTDDLSVYLVDPSQTVSSTALSSSEYTLKYYKEGTELTSLENLTDGKYQIWAYAANPYTSYPETFSNFIFIDVIDGVVSIALSNASTGTFTQASSVDDEMTSTWEYTLTYASGNTEPIHGTDSNIKISGLDTSTVATDATAVVTYTKVYANGTTDTVTCNVTYTITSATTVVVAYANISELQSTLGSSITTETSLATGTDGSSISVTASSDKTVDIDENGKSIDGFSFTYRLKLGGAGDKTYRSIKVVTTGAAKITVYGISSSNGTTRYLALYDSDYEALDTTQSDDGSAITRYTYTVSAAGTYYIASTSGGMNVYYVSISM